MWVLFTASDTWRTTVGDRTAVVGCSNGRWYWYAAAKHRVFAGDWAERENNRIGNKPVMFHDGPPATLDEWMGKSIEFVDSQAQAMADAEKFINS